MEYRPKATHIESLKLLDVVAVGCTSLILIEERWYDYGCIHQHFSWQPNVVMYQHLGAQALKGEAGLADPCIDIFVHRPITWCGAT